MKKKFRSVKRGSTNAENENSANANNTGENREPFRHSPTDQSGSWSELSVLQQTLA